MVVAQINKCPGGGLPPFRHSDPDLRVGDIGILGVCGQDGGQALKQVAVLHQQLGVGVAVEVVL